MATSVVGSCSCLLKNHFAGVIVPTSFPSSNTLTAPVIICFCASLVTVRASCRIVNDPTVICLPGPEQRFLAPA